MIASGLLGGGALVGPQRGEDLVVLGEAAGLVLREDDLAVADHVELTFAAGDVRRSDVVGS